MFNKLKYEWNNQLEKLKVKGLVQCRVTLYDRHKCTNIVKWTRANNGRCKEHARIFAQEVEQYHMIRKLPKISHPSLLGLVALIELEQRRTFARRQDLATDWGHQRWNEALERTCRGMYEINGESRIVEISPDLEEEVEFQLESHDEWSSEGMARVWGPDQHTETGEGVEQWPLEPNGEGGWSADEVNLQEWFLDPETESWENGVWSSDSN